MLALSSHISLHLCHRSGEIRAGWLFSTTIHAEDISAYVNALKGINTAAQDNFAAAVNGNKASGVDGIKGNPDDASATDEKDLRAMNAMVEAFNKKTGGK